MNYEKERKILTDVDGVLLNWEESFTVWMAEKGYTIQAPDQYKQSIRYGIQPHTADRLVEQFNTSAWIGFIKPLRDAVPMLEQFARNHWHFECITSLSTDHWAGELRLMNLERFFGRQSIRRCRCIATGADKDDILKEYEPGYWWIEDKPVNAVAGLLAGHRPILIDHPYNRGFDHPDIIRAKDWQEVHTIITTE